MTAFVETTKSYQPGARTLPGRYYCAEDVLANEQTRLFSQQWLCAGRASEIAEPGQYLLATIGGESIIVVRDQERTINAFYNVCRHRGTRLCEDERGQFEGTIQCPYHAWTYRLDGRLVGTPHMTGTPEFDKRDYPLHSVALAEWEGFLFLNLSAAPRPFEEAFAPMIGRLARYHLASLRTVRRIEYSVGANWKLIMQNYSECLHCPTIHPELSTKLPYNSGANDLIEGPFLGGYMEIRAPNESATMSGRACGLPLGELPPDDRARAYYYTLFPSMMVSLHPDYALYYTVWPVSAMQSRVVCEWMVHPDSPESPGYNLGDAEEFWDVTNRQDWHICEQSQRGVASKMYRPGPYSPRESIPAAWDREYLKVMEEG